jgi:hypothetical protein
VPILNVPVAPLGIQCAAVNTTLEPTTVLVHPPVPDRKINVAGHVPGSVGSAPFMTSTSAPGGVGATNSKAAVGTVAIPRATENKKARNAQWPVFANIFVPPSLENIPNGCDAARIL